MVKEIPDDDGNLVPYHSCPMLFRTASTNEFLSMRDYLEKYPHTAPAYADRDARYVAMDRYYSARVDEYAELVKKEGG